MNEENHRGKTPPGEFKVITPENPSTLYQPTIEPLPQYPIGLVM